MRVDRATLPSPRLASDVRLPRRAPASARGEALSAREVMDMARAKSADLGKAAASGLRDAQRNLRETFGSRG